MNHINFPAATHNFGAPPDWDSSANGDCATLPVCVQGELFTSCWQPSDAERMAIANGEPIMLSVIGGQPAVMLWVEGVE